MTGRTKTISPKCLGLLFSSPLLPQSIASSYQPLLFLDLRINCLVDTVKCKLAVNSSSIQKYAGILCCEYVEVRGQLVGVYSLSTMWDPGISLRSPDLAASAFTYYVISLAPYFKLHFLHHHLCVVPRL